MKIFINDVPVKITSKEKVSKKKFDRVLYRKEDLTPDNLEGKVLVWNASDESIDELLKLMTKGAIAGLSSLTFAAKDKVRTVHYIKGKFSLVKAAGGIVRKGDKILLIYRLEKWDLPKGKLEKSESPSEGGMREVEEETGVKVILGEKVTSTLHTYIRNKKFVLKKTYWYDMECVDDSEMEPQVDEQIDEVKWMTSGEVDIAMKNSYRTIHAVIKRFRKVYSENQLS